MLFGGEVNGRREASMDISEKSRVTEPEARAAYVAMKGRRSLKRLHQNFTKDGLKTPSLRTLK